jgi:hypothetical protein
MKPFVKCFCRFCKGKRKRRPFAEQKAFKECQSAGFVFLWQQCQNDQHNGQYDERADNPGQNAK